MQDNQQPTDLSSTHPIQVFIYIIYIIINSSKPSEHLMFDTQTFKNKYTRNGSNYIKFIVK